MFGRKLFAIFVFLGAIGILVLFYLYFFVYYTSTLIIDANEDEFRGELISVRNAQIRPFTCSEVPCIISDIPPFQYRLILHKDDFKSQTLDVDITPRSTIELYVDFERQARLNLTSVVIEDQFFLSDTDSETIYARFVRGEDVLEFRIREGSERLDMYFIGPLGEIRLTDVARVPIGEIQVQTIRDTSDIHIRLRETNYIYDYNPSSLIRLPLQVPVRYVKRSHENGKYNIVTDVGTFVYTKQTNQAEFQYGFRDYVVIDSENIVGIIFPEDEERKRNFGFEDTRGALIVLQNPRSRERSILLDTSESIEQIHVSQGDIIITTTDDIIYRLENF